MMKKGTRIIKFAKIRLILEVKTGDNPSGLTITNALSWKESQIDTFCSELHLRQDPLSYQGMLAILVRQSWKEEKWHLGQCFLE